ncbi:suppressor of fused domain protein [Bailinhaonella thermotolerans]|uniref:Suppressor of fused domain protein n=1 Tax=Bailinhaonella thermotolerans TaxID=1070861 RepID=A0A3A4A2G2_9ACTN|nr:suppressor of fused domain protein [Bailinhaonella thermotolerans]RJL21748.1 suppressor of fused domain protein [Bailinhaonella thermotolerans]
MAIFRTGGTAPEGTHVVVSDISPYGSRDLVVEYDGVTSVAYLRDPASEAVRGAVWLANHVPAPAAVDLGRVSAGMVPPMPASATRHPSGRPPLNPAELGVLWFEEGDGVALLERGELLAVIPGWGDPARGMPGYARDALGETPLAWPLAEALEGLGPRVDKAGSYWRWRRGEGAWETFQQFIMGHLDTRLGPGARYWDAGGDLLPTVGITEHPPARDRAYTMLSTVGMSCQRMPTVEQYVEDPGSYARIELAIATRGDSKQAARLFLWLARYPWHSVTWLGHGHTAKWYHEPATFPLGHAWQGVLMLADVRRLPGPEVPDLSGFSFGGDPVTWLWLIPITEAERRIATERGHEALRAHLTAQRRSWVVG